MSSGLTVSRLGVQATAYEDVVHGLICLRISIPRDNDANHALRWNLFSSKPPRLVSPPSIHPLPLPLAFRSSSTPRTARPRALAIASTLLSLPAPSTYPPNRHGVGPHLDVSPKSGQVCVVLDPCGRKGKQQQHASPSSSKSGGGKAEWVVIMEFETTVEAGSERGFNKVMLSLPKCLHSVIRFQVTPPSVGPSSRDGEVSIMTEPKMLALPPSTFTTPATPLPRPKMGAVGFDDGWEDAEDMRDGQISEGEGSEDDDGGSWLEGRFQATSQLRLEWSFASAAHAKSLQVMPRWDPRHPAINIVYECNGEALSAAADQLVPIEFVVPDGWGWKDLDISGPGLLSWQSTDFDHFRVQLRDVDEDEDGPDDSFATIRNRVLPQQQRRPLLQTHNSASLMKQTLPVAGDMKVDDFSFEMTSMDHLTIPASTGSGGSGSHQSRPGTPARPSPGLAPDQGVALDQPSPASCFDLVFATNADDRSYYVEGTLVPLSPLTLVSGSAPVQIPFVRAAGTSSCAIICPNSTLSDGSQEEGIYETTQTTIGTFAWTDMYGSPILPLPTEPIRGNVHVRLYRGQWGTISMSVVFPWPDRGPECAFTLALPEDASARVSRADLAGAAVPRAVTRTEQGYEVRLGQGVQSRAAGQLAEVTIDLGDIGHEVPLPVFADAEGKMTVELRGDGWTSVLPNLKTTLTRDTSSPTTFHTSLPSRNTPYIRIAPHTTSSSSLRRRTLFSLSTFFNLFMLWLVISLGQQVQRLRTEISFVAEEAKDLRMYGYDQPTVTVTADHAGPTILPDGVDLKELLERLRHQHGEHDDRPTRNANVERSLGRVVFGSSGWHKWSNSPAVRSLSRGVIRIWDVFVWLIRGP